MEDGAAAASLHQAMVRAAFDEDGGAHDGRAVLLCDVEKEGRDEEGGEGVCLLSLGFQSCLPKPLKKALTISHYTLHY